MSFVHFLSDAQFGELELSCERLRDFISVGHLYWSSYIPASILFTCLLYDELTEVVINCFPVRF